MPLDNWRSLLQESARRWNFHPRSKRFYFLRHGQTEHNRQRICQGHTDVPLNERGKAQADAAAALLAPAKPVAVRASDLVRVRQTASPVAEALGLPIDTDQKLRERAFGIYEDKLIEGHLWSFDHPSIESIDAFVDRSLRGFDWAIDRDDVLVVTHGGLRRVLAAALDVEMADWTAHNALPIHFTQNEDGAWQANILTKTGRWSSKGPVPEDLDR